MCFDKPGIGSWNIFSTEIPRVTVEHLFVGCDFQVGCWNYVCGQILAGIVTDLGVSVHVPPVWVVYAEILDCSHAAVFVVDDGLHCVSGRRRLRQ